MRQGLKRYACFIEKKAAHGLERRGRAKFFRRMLLFPLAPCGREVFALQWYKYHTASALARFAREEVSMDSKKTAVVTVIGRDTIGIIAQVTRVLAEHKANILDISQTVLSEMFNMVMIIDVSLTPFDALSDALSRLGKEMGLQMRVQRSEIFDTMHRI